MPPRPSQQQALEAQQHQQHLQQQQQLQQQQPPPFVLLDNDQLEGLQGNALLVDDDTDGEPDAEGGNQVYEIHADDNEEAMMELAIALSLQDQVSVGNILKLGLRWIRKSSIPIFRLTAEPRKTLLILPTTAIIILPFRFKNQLTAVKCQIRQDPVSATKKVQPLLLKAQRYAYLRLKIDLRPTWQLEQRRILAVRDLSLVSY